MPVKVTFENLNGKYSFYCKEEVVFEIIDNVDYFDSLIIDTRNGNEYRPGADIKAALKIDPIKTSGE